MKRAYLLLILILLGVQSITAQDLNLLQGQIVDTESKAVPNVMVRMEGAMQAVQTDAKGFFKLWTQEDRVRLIISNPKFETQKIWVDLSDEEDNTIRLSLNPKTYLIEEIVINADRNLQKTALRHSLERQKSIPGGSSVISMKSLNTQRSLTLKDALFLQPGVMIQEFFGANDQPRLNIRGSGIQSNPQRRGINLLQDGISTNLSDGSYIIGIMEPKAASYIEVFRGANALKYGATTLGGAINLISKTGYTASSPLELKLEGGSFGYLGGSLSSGFVSGKSDGYATVSHNTAKGYREYNTSKRTNVSVNFGYRFNPHFESRIYATYTDLKFDIPGPLTQAQIDENPKQINAGTQPPKSIGPNVVRDKPKRFSEVVRIANKNVYQINKNSSLSLGLSYQNIDDTFVFPTPVGVRESLSNDAGGYLTFNNKTEKNELTLGLNYSSGVIKRKYFINKNGVADRQYADNKLSSSNFILFAEDIYRLTDRLSAVAAIQFSSNCRNNEDLFLQPDTRPFFSFKTKSYGVFASQDTSLDQKFTGFNPRLGLIYNWDKATQLFVNFSRSYEPPTFDELLTQGKGNPNLSPMDFRSVKLKEQTGSTAEIGTRGNIGRLVWDASYYYSWVKNEILTTTDLFGISGSTRNSPDTTIHQGLELGLKAVLFKNILSNNDALSLRSVYNYSNFYFKEGLYKDHQIAGIPKHYLAGSLEYHHPEGFFAALNTEWLPEKTPTDHQNTVYQKAYQLFGFRAGYDQKKWGIYVESKNLGNTHYASSYLIRDVVANPKPPKITNANVTTFIPGSGFNIIGGLYYKL